MAEIEFPLDPIRRTTSTVQVKLWLAQMWEVDDATLQLYKSWFYPEEHRRFDGFLNERRSREYIVGHGLARRALAQELACPAESLQFDTDDQGKLTVGMPRVGTQIHFNITHTADFVGCATCRECEVGVDVEKVHERISALEIAARFFSKDESQALCKLDGSEILEAFFTIWTLKEALAKAHGLGLAAPLESSRFEIIGDGIIEAVTSYPPFSRGTWLACCSPTPAHRLALSALCEDQTNVAICPQEANYSGDLDTAGFSWATGRLKND